VQLLNKAFHQVTRQNNNSWQIQNPTIDTTNTPRQTTVSLEEDMFPCLKKLSDISFPIDLPTNTSTGVIESIMTTTVTKPIIIPTVNDQDVHTYVTIDLTSTTTKTITTDSQQIIMDGTNILLLESFINYCHSSKLIRTI